MKKRKFGQRSRYMIIVSVFLIILNASLGLMLFQQSKNALIEQIRGRMLDIANTAADTINGDELKTLKKEDKGTAKYQKVIRTLTCFQDNIEMEYIYCIKDNGNKEFVFSVDPTIEDPGEFGEPIQYTDALYSASLGTAAVDKTPYEDRWGKFYSAYSPVYDSIGGVAGIVAVDFSADWYERQITGQLRTILLFCVLSILAGGLLVFIITEQSRRRYRMLYSQLNELAVNVEDLISEIESTPSPKTQTPDTEGKHDNIEDLGEKILSLQDTLRTEIAHIHRQAYVDALTSVRNKAAYMDVINRLDQEIDNNNAAFTVATFDLNGLKLINDNYGHESGDQALIETANILISVFGRDHIFRVGGDEFIVILRDCTEEMMDAYFEEFDNALGEENKKKQTDDIKLSASKGCAVFTEGEDREYRTVYKRADDAMYRDKEAYYAKYSERRRAVYQKRNSEDGE